MIRRARLGLLAAVVVAVALVGVQFPLTQLWHEHSAEAAASHELQELRQADSALSKQVAALEQPATVARIAHQDYGLVARGETYVVVLPGPADTYGGAGPLADTKLPASALVPSDATVAAPASDGSGPSTRGESFWSRLLQRLEFWKAVP